MSNITLIMGESGTGKSTSIRTLDPMETYVINVLDKPLPFRAFRKNYIKHTKEAQGNYTATDNGDLILRVLSGIDKTMPHIKTIIIDDFQYIMANEFMRRSLELGYKKFSEIGKTAHAILTEGAKLRDDLDVFILSHTEIDEDGKLKCKTIGKMLDQNVTLEGMFTIIKDESYKFLTQHDGKRIAKSPMDMFEDKLIDNDLLAIKAKMAEYYSDTLPTL